MGLVVIGVGLWSEGLKEEENSEQRSGDFVLGGCVPEQQNRIHRDKVESEEQRKPEHERFLTTCHWGSRSYQGPVEYYNKESSVLAIGTYYKV